MSVIYLLDPIKKAHQTLTRSANKIREEEMRGKWFLKALMHAVCRKDTRGTVRIQLEGRIPNSAV